ncbi:MFS transporter [Rhizosaccharibacter radicis]|uniref:MFS transporter n=1 Tax=Rhizosaccharibacter radicis TaxID=2782605 RepID=A0ABT1W027_9PROT|nr:MFS transporter [Acetobacteraceae bacterium KSS12]
MLFATHGSVFGSWATQIPLIKARLHIDPGTLGLVLLCLAAGGVFAMQGASRVMGRLGGLPLLRGSLLLSAGALLAASLAPNPPALAAALGAMGMGLGTLDLVMNAQAVTVERRLRRPVMSGLHGMWSLGTLLGTFAGAALLWWLPGPLEAGVVAACGAAAALLANRFLLPMTPERRDAPRGIGLLQQPGLLATGAAMAMAFAVEGALLDWSAVFLRETRHVPDALAGIGYGVFAGCTLSGRLIGDRLRARWGDLALLRGAFVCGAALLLAAAAPGPWLPILCFAATGLALGNIAPILFNAVGQRGADYGAEGSSRALGSAVSFAYAGVSVAPPLFGFVARHSSLGAALCCAAGVAFVLGSCTLLPGRWRLQPG